MGRNVLIKTKIKINKNILTTHKKSSKIIRGSHDTKYRNQLTLDSNRLQNNGVDIDVS